MCNVSACVCVYLNFCLYLCVCLSLSITSACTCDRGDVRYRTISIVHHVVYFTVVCRVVYCFVVLCRIVSWSMSSLLLCGSLILLYTSIPVLLYFFASFYESLSLNIFPINHSHNSASEYISHNCG